MYRYFGVVKDGLGKPLAGVRVSPEGGARSFAEGSRLVTDGSGTYEFFTSGPTTLYMIFRASPGSVGYQTYSIGMQSAGEYNVTLKRAVSASCNIPSTIKKGTENRKSVRATATFDDGTTESRSADWLMHTGNRDILKAGTGGGLHVEGVSPGITTAWCSYFGVASTPRTIEVMP